MPRRPARPESWPRCPGGCGHAAPPQGKPSLSIRFEIETRSEANVRERWGKINRASKARDTTIEEVAVALGEGQELPAIGPWYVRITRLSSGTLDRDNLGRALKAIQDTIAAMLKVDDGSPMVEWDPKQRVEEGFLGVEIELWGPAGLP